MPISFSKEPEHGFDEETELFLEQFAEEYKDTNAMDLVRLSHAPGKPWEKAYEKGHGDSVIPFDSIVGLECQKD